MTKRKLLIALAVAGIFVATFGGSVVSASAEQRTLLVTLVGGRQLTVTVDVPPGTPVDQIKLPGVTQPIALVKDVTPPAAEPPPAPTPEPAPTTAPTPQAPQDQAPAKADAKPKAKAKRSDKPQGDVEARARDRSAIEDAATAAERRRRRDEAKAEAIASAKRKARVRAERARAKARAKAEAEAEAEAEREARAKAEAERKAGAKANAPAPAAPASTASAPTDTGLGLGLGLPSPPPVGVPNFFIDSFRIPPFLLPIYQAAGIEYGVRWEILAAINEIETDYGRNLNVSSAGAVGWMQFLPSTWAQYGVDANRDGRKDPYSPVDAIFAAARYLKAARADQDVRRAIFAYNHADWYVDSVLVRARLIGSLPADLVGSLSGLTQGHFPVFAKRPRYADGLTAGDTRRRVARGANAAVPVESSERDGIDIFAKEGAPVVATQDGRIVRMGTSARLGRYVQLRDVYGNTYTYGGLKTLATAYPVPRDRSVTDGQVRAELRLPKADPRPTAPASAGRQPARAAAAARRDHRRARVTAPKVRKERLFAHPARPLAWRAGGRRQLDTATDTLAPHDLKAYFTQVYGLGPGDVVLRPLKRGAKVIAGTVLGRIGAVEPDVRPHVRFEIRPAGRGAPRIDPKPILDGWKLLASTAVYRAAGATALAGADTRNPSIGQILLMSKEALQQRVLADERIDVYACGRRDIRAGEIDRRVLATLEFLASSGLRPTVTSLHCGHGFYTSSGNVSEHSSGSAVDIAAINGVPILGHQGAGSITDITVRRLLTLQGTIKPHQIISLMTFEGVDNALALPDHDDHIHVGFHPLFGTNAKLGAQLDAILKPGQWAKLMNRLGRIENPTVLTSPSKYSIKVGRPGIRAHGLD